MNRHSQDPATTAQTPGHRSPFAILRRPAMAAATALIALSAVTAACGGGGGSPESDLRGRLDDYLNAVLEDDNETIADISFPPSLRGDCSIDELAAGIAESSQEEFDEDFDPGEAGVQDVELELHGEDEATVSYYATYEGIANPFPVEFDWVREDGEWYLDLGQAGPCDSGLDGGSDGDSSSSGDSGSDAEDAVRERFDEFVSRIQDEDWDGLYSMLSERMREGCSEGDYADLSASDFEDAGADPSDYEPENIRITLSDDKAAVAYDVSMPGFETMEVVNYFVYEDGEWRDDGTADFATSNGCGDETSGSAPRATATRTTAARTTAAPRATATRPRTTPTARASATVSASTPVAIRPDGAYGTTARATVTYDGQTFEFTGGQCVLDRNGRRMEIHLMNGSDEFFLGAVTASSSVQQSIGTEELVVQISIVKGSGGYLDTSGIAPVLEITSDLMSGTFSGTFLRSDAPGAVEFTGSFSC